MQRENEGEGSVLCTKVLLETVLSDFVSALSAYALQPQCHRSDCS